MLLYLVQATPSAGEGLRHILFLQHSKVKFLFMLHFLSLSLSNVVSCVMYQHKERTEGRCQSDILCVFGGGGLNELSLLAKPLYLNDENHEMIQLTSSYGQQEKKKKNSSLTS